MLSTSIWGGVIDIYDQRKYLLSDFHLKSIKEIFQRFIHKFSNKSWIILGILCLAAILYHLFFQVETIRELPDGRHISWLAYISRLTIYPFIFSLYPLNESNILIFLSVMVLFIVSTYVIANKSEKKILWIMLLSFFLYSSIFTYGRPDMAIHYTSSSTYPDRYVYAINIQFIIILLYCLDILYKKTSFYKVFSIILLILLMIPYFKGYKNIIQFDKILASITRTSFNTRIDEAFTKHEGTDVNIYKIIIEPPRVTFNIPKNYFMCSYLHLNQMPKYIQIDTLTDQNWMRGVNRHNQKILLIKSDYYQLIKLIDNISVIVMGKKYMAKITTIKQYGTYLHIITDIEDASVFAYPAKIEYELK